LALIRWFIAGIVAAAVFALVELALLRSATDGVHLRSVMTLATALHLTFGGFIGVCIGAVSWALGGVTIDSISRNVVSFFKPDEELRDRHAAKAFVVPLLAIVLTAVLFVINLRFFKFNNQGLAALLLVVVNYMVLFGVWLGYSAAMEFVGKQVAKLSQRWPAVGNSPAVWLSVAVGVILGGLSGVVAARADAFAENWEAITVGPLIGLALLMVACAVAEWLVRTVAPRLMYSLGVLAMVCSIACWAMAFMPPSLEGTDNSHVHDEAWIAGLYLTVAERITDRDKDGFSPLFGHGDCNDNDDKAWPGSLDGEDCTPDVALENKAAFVARLRGTDADRTNTSTHQPGGSAGSGNESPPKSSTPSQNTSGSRQPVKAPPAAAQKLKRPYNVVLITMDTVRNDHMGYMGYKRDTTPHMDKLAKQSLVYERAYSTSNMTPSAVPSMITGLYTSELHRDNRHFIRYSSKNTFLAEMLKTVGYETHGIMSHWYFLNNKSGSLSEGFDSWQVLGTRPGRRMEDVPTSHLVSRAALEKITALPSDKPWFLWLHFIDPHKWYIFHDGFEKRWGKGMIDRYDHEIAYTDHHIGKILKALKKHPSAQRTAVIINADHGEAFAEHKRRFHGFTVYEEELRVPFLIHVPGLTPKRLKKRVSLIDVVPTILDLAQTKSKHQLQGRSLLPDYLRKKPTPQRLVYAERVRGPHSSGMRMLIDGDLKLCFHAGGNRYELYDLARDPREKKNLFKKDPASAKRMVSALKSMVKLAMDTKGKVRRVK